MSSVSEKLTTSLRIAFFFALLYYAVGIRAISMRQPRCREHFRLLVHLQPRRVSIAA